MAHANKHVNTVVLVFYSYRASEPPELVDLQNKEWDPLVDWLEERSVELIISLVY